MTKVDRFVEVEVKVFHSWEIPCYWCGGIFKKDFGRTKMKRNHVNIFHEPKVFCSNKCKLAWIYAKQTFGELLP